MSRQIGWTPRNRRRIEPFETTMCDSQIPVAFHLRTPGAWPSALTFAANIRKHPGSTPGHGARCWRRAEVWVCVGANRARQLLRLGTEVVKSQLAEIGLVSTLLDSGAQDRDDIANDSVLARLGQLGQGRIPRRCSGGLRAGQRDDIPAECPAS